MTPTTICIDVPHCCFQLLSLDTYTKNVHCMQLEIAAEVIHLPVQSVQ